MICPAVGRGGEEIWIPVLHSLSFGLSEQQDRCFHERSRPFLCYCRSSAVHVVHFVVSFIFILHFPPLFLVSPSFFSLSFPVRTGKPLQTNSYGLPIQHTLSLSLLSSRFSRLCKQIGRTTAGVEGEQWDMVCVCVCVCVGVYIFM